MEKLQNIDRQKISVGNIPVAGSAGLEINFPPESHRGDIRARSNSLVSSQLAARKEVTPLPSLTLYFYSNNDVTDLYFLDDFFSFLLFLLCYE